MGEARTSKAVVSGILGLCAEGPLGYPAAAVIIRSKDNDPDGVGFGMKGWGDLIEPSLISFDVMYVYKCVCFLGQKKRESIAVRSVGV
ncbi:hypothetical protein RRG08_034226 [Elysia crispata]|uniref:Uncharacterized protein n=1 Tax=Elysia crispata TaxID=231223 RepID=A0AAE1DQV9_9GAST|nr:hypothetical protein RRG08_034226 [Elysia crispata]